MSMAIAGTVLTVGATAYSADQAGDAADAQVAGSKAATAETSRQYNQTRADTAGQRSIGNSATNRLASLYGLGMAATEGEFDAAAYLQQNPDVAADPYWGANPEAHYQQYGMREGRARPSSGGGTQAVAAGTGDTSAFTQSPGYQFRRDEGMRDIGNSFAAGGGAFSGNALKALADWNGQNASQEFGNYVNQLNTLAGYGQSATSQTTAAGTSAANQASQNALYAGDARASGVENQANIIGEGVNQLGQMAGYYRRSTGVSSAYPTGYGGYQWTTPGIGDGWNGQRYA